MQTTHSKISDDELNDLLQRRDQNFVENELVIFSKQTSDVLLSQENPGDVIALYFFYYYTAKWQGTSQPKATTDYVSKGLNWSPEKVRTTKKVLSSLGLVKDIQRKNESGKTTGWYIKLNYFWKAENHPTGKPECGLNQSVVLEEANASTIISINAPTIIKKNVGKPTLPKISGDEEGEIPFPKADSFFGKSKDKKINGISYDGLPMTRSEFVLMCRGSAYRHVRIIGEYADEREMKYSTRGQWREFGNRNLQVAKKLAPFSESQMEKAMTRMEADIKSPSNPRGFISTWGLETLFKYLEQI